MTITIMLMGSVAAGPDDGDDVVHAAMMTACRRNDKHRQVAECQTANMQEEPGNLHWVVL